MKNTTLFHRFQHKCYLYSVFTYDMKSLGKSNAEMSKKLIFHKEYKKG